MSVDSSKNLDALDNITKLCKELASITQRNHLAKFRMLHDRLEQEINQMNHENDELVSTFNSVAAVIEQTVSSLRAEKETVEKETAAPAQASQENMMSVKMNRLVLQTPNGKIELNILGGELIRTRSDTFLGTVESIIPSPVEPAKETRYELPPLGTDGTIPMDDSVPAAPDGPFAPVVDTPTEAEMLDELPPACGKEVEKDVFDDWKPTVDLPGTVKNESQAATANEARAEKKAFIHEIVDDAKKRLHPTVLVGATGKSVSADYVFPEEDPGRINLPVYMTGVRYDAGTNQLFIDIDNPKYFEEGLHSTSEPDVWVYVFQHAVSNYLDGGLSTVTAFVVLRDRSIETVAYLPKK